MDTAAPPVGRRAGAGAIAVLLGYLLLAPPVFLLGPLAALLAVSRPGTWREWIWLVASVALTAVWLVAPGNLAQQVVRAGAMGLAGATLAVALSGRPASAFRQSVTAGIAATIGTVVWAAVLGTSFGGFQASVAGDLRAAYQALAATPRTSGSAEVTRLLEFLLSSADAIASIYPGLFVVLGVAGCLLAWQWLHRIAATPVGVGPGRFREFRFNDQVIWGAILTLALWVAPMPDAARLVAANLLVVWTALFVLRGLAVVAAMMAGGPWPLRAAMALFAVLFLPFATGGLLAMGLADIWVDFRRRTPPVPGGQE